MLIGTCTCYSAILKHRWRNIGCSSIGCKFKRTTSHFKCSRCTYTIIITAAYVKTVSSTLCKYISAIDLNIKCIFLVRVSGATYSGRASATDSFYYTAEHFERCVYSRTTVAIKRTTVARFSISTIRMLITTPSTTATSANTTRTTDATCSTVTAYSRNFSRINNKIIC